MHLLEVIYLSRGVHAVRLIYVHEPRCHVKTHGEIVRYLEIEIGAKVETTIVVVGVYAIGACREIAHQAALGELSQRHEIFQPL